MKPPKCTKCGAASDRVKMRRIVNMTGVSMFAWYCLQCNKWAENPAKYFKHADLIPLLKKQGATIDDIPIVNDYRERCAVCGQHGAESHHFLPQTLASHPDVAPDWNGRFGGVFYGWETQRILLCKYHHDLWHDLVTPWMPGRGNSRKLTT